MNVYDDYVDDVIESHKEIIRELGDMSEDEVSEFGSYLYGEFFGEDDFIYDYNEYFSYEDVIELIISMGVESYDVILDSLQEIHYDIDEGVSKKMNIGNFNKKKRKFQKKTANQLKKEKMKAKLNYKRNKGKIKRYRNKNKSKIKKYQKSRNDAIQKGKHKVKLRRK